MCIFNIGKCLFNIGMRRTLHLTRFTMRDCFSFNKFLSESDIWSSGRFFIGSARTAFLLISSAKSLSVQAFLTLVHKGGGIAEKSQYHNSFNYDADLFTLLNKSGGLLLCKNLKSQLLHY